MQTESLKLRIWPVDIAASGVTGIGGAILVLIIIVLSWVKAATPYVF